LNQTSSLLQAMEIARKLGQKGVPVMVSAWSAKCKVKGDPMSCVDAPDLPDRPPDFKGNHKHTIPDYAWTDMTQLLHDAHVSWRYYVMKGTEPDCRDDAAMTCAAIPQDSKTPGIWNPLPYFTTVRENWQLEELQLESGRLDEVFRTITMGDSALS